MITVIAVNLYLVVFTPYWPVTVLMLTWLAFDWKTPERGEGPGSAVATRQGGEGRGLFKVPSEAQVGTGVGLGRGG